MTTPDETYRDEYRPSERLEEPLRQIVANAGGEGCGCGPKSKRR